ncbi:MAG: hypothetical protein HZC28_07160 [Spirochaetes bacterium]|nr:hypothetical protein [Spirochaetota bacterium]
MSRQRILTTILCAAIMVAAASTRSVSGATIISADALTGAITIKAVGSPETSFEIAIKESKEHAIEGDAAVGLKFRHTDVKNTGDYVRLDMYIPRGVLNLIKGTAYIHFKAPQLPASGSFYLLIESPGANAVMQLKDFRKAADGYVAVALNAGDILSLPGTKTKIDPSVITRIFLGIASVKLDDGGVVYMDAVTDKPLAPVLNPDAAEKALPASLSAPVQTSVQASVSMPAASTAYTTELRIVTNAPYKHSRNYDDLEDRTSADIRSYPAPQGSPVFEGRKAVLMKGGKSYDIPLYTTPVWGGAAYHGGIDCNMPATISVAVSDISVTSVIVRPLSKKITPKLSDGRIQFDITGPGKYIVELNGGIDDAIIIFVNPLEKNPPVGSNDSVIYFAPGYYENIAIAPTNRQTVYIAGGAYLYRSRISIRDSDNVTVRGRGIVDTAARFNNYQKDPTTGHCLSAWNANNLTVEGVTFLDSDTFCTVYRKSHDVRIRNVKVIAKDGNTDQNDIVGCQRVHVSDVFYRGYDDGIVLKLAIEVKDQHCHDILAENAVIWTDLAHPLTIGTEVLNNIYNVMFTNIDILHVRQPAHKSRALAIHVGDNGTVHDVTFTDIRIESLSKALVNGNVDFIQLEVKPNVYSKTKLPGYMRNITFRNIQLFDAPHFPITTIRGADAEHTIENITFDNVTVLGTNMKTFENMMISTNGFVRNIKIVEASGKTNSY